MQIIRGTKFLMVAGAFVGVCAGEGIAEKYSITELGVVREPFFKAVSLSHNEVITNAGPAGWMADTKYTGINNAGQVTGTILSPDTTSSEAFIYNKGTRITIGTLGGSYSTSGGINNSGEVTGHSMVADRAIHAFVYSKGKMIDLGTLGGNNSFGKAINNSGQVTGDSTISGSGEFHAFLYSGGVMSDLGTLGGYGSAGLGINNSGQVTGYSYTEISQNPGTRAFIYSQGAMSELGTLGGNHSIGYAINDAGDVTGGSSTAGDLGFHAFLYSKGEMKDLGINGEGHAINNAGQVVGRFNNPNSSAAFLFRDGVITDLNTLLPDGSGWYLYDATGINDSGQITGVGSKDGVICAFVMTPDEKIKIGSASGRK